MLSLYDLLVTVAFNWFSVFCGFVLLLFCYSILIKASCLLRPSRDISFYKNGNTSLSNMFMISCCQAADGSVSFCQAKVIIPLVF